MEGFTAGESGAHTVADAFDYGRFACAVGPEEDDPKPAPVAASSTAARECNPPQSVEERFPERLAGA